MDDTLHLINAQGNDALSLASAVKGTKDGGRTYAATSSSDENILKYRFNHTFKLDAELTIKKFDIGVSINYTSYMKSIDYLFVSDLITTPGVISDEIAKAFDGLKRYREDNKRGNTDLGARLAYNITDKIKVAVIAKNLLNQEIMMRPAFMSNTRNYAAQLSVEF